MTHLWIFLLVIWDALQAVATSRINYIIYFASSPDSLRFILDYMNTYIGGNVINFTGEEIVSLYGELGHQNYTMDQVLHNHNTKKNTCWEWGNWPK